MRLGVVFVGGEIEIVQRVRKRIVVGLKPAVDRRKALFVV